jgi:hypothetical protein
MKLLKVGSPLAKKSGEEEARKRNLHPSLPRKLFTPKNSKQEQEFPVP